MGTLVRFLLRFPFHPQVRFPGRRRPGKPGVGEGGSVTPLLVVLMVFTAFVGLGLVRLAVAATSKARAQQAADAAALAGARIDLAEATRLALANGALLTNWSEEFVGNAHLVVVEVVIDDMTATAQARWDPPPTTAPAATTSVVTTLTTDPLTTDPLTTDPLTTDPQTPDTTPTEPPTTAHNGTSQTASDPWAG